MSLDKLIKRKVYHFIRNFLEYEGIRVVRTRERIPKEFLLNYNRYFGYLKDNQKEFKVIKDLCYEAGEDHPLNYIDFECAFAASCISRLKPREILDIGSYRHFILGMLSCYQITTIDVRNRSAVSDNEIVVTCDAKKLGFTDNKFDIVLSLCALEHFGLGRYGDEFDKDADKKAFNEMARVLKPGGHIIFTTSITKREPFVAFNAQRVYNYEMIRQLCASLTCIEEKFYSHKLLNFCSLKEISDMPGIWDVYCGCYRKS